MLDNNYSVDKCGETMGAGTKKERRKPLFDSEVRLTLGELRCPTSLLQTVLLPFLHSWISSQVTCLLQHRPEFCIGINQRPCQTMAHSTGLTTETTACDGNKHVILPFGTCGNQRLTNDCLQHRTFEVFVNIQPIDNDPTATFLQPYPGYRSLSATCPIVILLHNRQVVHLPQVRSLTLSVAAPDVDAQVLHKP